MNLYIKHIVKFVIYCIPLLMNGGVLIATDNVYK